MNSNKHKLRVGEWVEIRSKEEILRTLDCNGQLDGMPFMPEMFAFCGKRFQVYKRAHKTCDTVFPIRGRRVDDAVHLETRCDGSAHGGCQAGCLIFWKMAWVRPPDGGLADDRHFIRQPPDSPTECTQKDVCARSQTEVAGETVYSCQATQLPYATKQLEWWDVRQYVEDYTSGNVGLWRIICGVTYSLYHSIIQAGIGLGPAMRWFYDRFHPLWKGTPFPQKSGTIPDGETTPALRLDLRPGELVRIKSQEEILKTLNTSNFNRGLYWDAEEVVYCGGIHKVLASVTKIIDEKTGKMQEMKTPCIILDSVACQSRYSKCRMFCPRSIYAYWREIWLERLQMEVPETRKGESVLSK